MKKIFIPFFLILSIANIVISNDREQKETCEANCFEFIINLNEKFEIEIILPDKIAISKKKNGRLDDNFGTQGVCIIQTLYVKPTNFKYLAIEEDGKIVIRGYGNDIKNNYTVVHFIIILNSNGTLDTSFNRTGIWRFII